MAGVYASKGPLGRLLITVLLTCVAFSALADEPLQGEDRAAVRDVIDGQIQAFRVDDHQSAYSFAAPSVREAFPTEEMFITMVRNQYQPLYRPVSYTFGRSSLDDDEVLQELLVTDANRQLWQVVYTLVRQQDKSWKITNVMMLPYKGISA